MQGRLGARRMREDDTEHVFAIHERICVECDAQVMDVCNYNFVCFQDGVE